MRILKNIFIGIGGFVVLFYMSTVVFFMLYFEYLYAKEFGFVRWLLLGWLIPSLKALIWPIIIFG